MTPSDRQPPSISCVFPAFNEAGNLRTLVPEVLAILAGLSGQVEVIVVDDGSQDDTAQVMKTLCKTHAGVISLTLSRNFGKEAALTAGLDAATGDVVILMDADGQHPPSLLPLMLQIWEQGIDVVYALRKTREDQSSLQVNLTARFYQLINWGSRFAIPADAGDFRLMDRRVVEALKSLPERNRFMKGLYAWVGFSSTAIDYEPLPRAGGTSNFGLRNSLSLALTGVLAFSTKPLRALTWLGLIVSAASLAYGLWIIVKVFVNGIEAPGYASIMVAMMFLSGIQLLSIGVLAEYVGRIYEETKRRPMYLISDRRGAGLQTSAQPRAAVALQSVTSEARSL
jgi:polyisoprenyl-phosphate glycosyltransferase